MRLVARALSAERGGRVVFADLSFTVEAGTLLRVSGANGAGKTTLMRILAGLASASDGTCTWYRADQVALPAESTCFVGHANACHDALTVCENLTYAASLAGIDASLPSVTSALSAFGVSSLINRRFGTLSQGQRKRCALARLMVDRHRGQRAWLLDEPFVALDAETQAVLALVMAAELDAGGLVIYSSHQTVAINAPREQEVLL